MRKQERDTCASWIFIGFPLALASDNFPFQTLLSPLYSYLLSRKLQKFEGEIWLAIGHPSLVPPRSWHASKNVPS